MLQYSAAVMDGDWFVSAQCIGIQYSFLVFDPLHRVQVDVFLSLKFML